MGLVKHEVLELGTTEVTIGFNKKEEAVVVKSVDECVIFPFAETVAQVLQQEDLYTAMASFRLARNDSLNSMRRLDSHTISKFYDGHVWQTHPFYQQHCDACSILFYWDDVTVTNPIGQYKRMVIVLHHHVLA